MDRRVWALALAMGLVATIPGCDRGDDANRGGGGGRSTIDQDQLPDSNDVNPSHRPDQYIDEESARKHEADDRRKGTPAP